MERGGAGGGGGISWHTVAQYASIKSWRHTLYAMIVLLYVTSTIVTQIITLTLRSYFVTYNRGVTLLL